MSPLQHREPKNKPSVKTNWLRHVGTVCIACGALLLVLMVVQPFYISLPLHSFGVLESIRNAMSFGRSEPTFSQTTVVEDATVRFELTAVEPQNQKIDIVITDANGKPIATQRAYLFLTMPGMMMGVSDIEANRFDGNRYRAEGSLFSMAGVWRVEASLERARDQWVRAPIEVVVSEDGMIQSVAPIAPTALPTNK